MFELADGDCYLNVKGGGIFLESIDEVIIIVIT